MLGWTLLSQCPDNFEVGWKLLRMRWKYSTILIENTIHQSPQNKERMYFLLKIYCCISTLFLDVLIFYSKLLVRRYKLKILSDMCNWRTICCTGTVAYYYVDEKCGSWVKDLSMLYLVSMFLRDWFLKICVLLKLQ